MITQNRLKELLEYNPKSGKFKWKINQGSRGKIGKEAGCRANGYIVIRINNELYYAHRLAWLYMTDNWPENDVDHINGKGIDNSWDNLRDITRRENLYNQQHLSTNNNSGYLGVFFRKELHINPWQAVITIERKTKHLGYYSTAKEASKVYLEFKEKLQNGTK